MRWLIVLVAVTTFSAGCFGGGVTQLSQEEAEEVAQDAMQAFAQDMADPDGGDLTTVRLTVGPAGQGLEVFFEWGLDGAFHQSLDTGEFGVQVSLTCDDRRVAEVEDTVVEARPGPCKVRGPSTAAGLNVTTLTDVQFDSVEVHGDNSIDVTLSNGTLHIDSKGRLTEMRFGEGGDAVVADIGYGPRRHFVFPEVDARMPVFIAVTDDRDGDRHEWRALAGEQKVLFDEIEVRVVDGDATVAVFTPGQDAENGGFSFVFTDDGDGEFGGHDAFTITSSSWGSAEVVVWDTWADREINDLPVESAAGVLLTTWL